MITSELQPQAVAPEFEYFADVEFRVLIVEHNSELASALKPTLARAGFKVTTLNPGEDPHVAVQRDEPHLVMIDWDLPALIAMDLVRRIRRTKLIGCPRLLALSSFSGEQHVVSGFEQGVDDYVIKPFSVIELLARIRALLRSRHLAPERSQNIDFRELQMDAIERRVTVRDKRLSLRYMEFELLQFLMRRPERAYTRVLLLQNVWGNDHRASERAVDVTIQRIRHVLAEHGCAGYLQTIRGVGYRLSATGVP